MTPKLRTWHFLPEPCRSLDFYDKFFGRICRNCKCCTAKSAGNDEVSDEYKEKPDTAIKGKICFADNDGFTPDVENNYPVHNYKESTNF